MTGGVPVLLLWLTAAFAVAATRVATAEDPSEHVQPTESECRPYIEKALKQLGTTDTPPGSLEDTGSMEAEIIPSLGDNDQQDVHSIELEGEESEEPATPQGDDISVADEESNEGGRSTAQEHMAEENKSMEEGEKSIEDGGEQSIEEGGEESIEEGDKESIEEGDKESIEKGGERSIEDRDGVEQSIEDGGEQSREEGGEKSREEGGEKSREEGGEKSAEEEGHKSVEEEGHKSVEEEGQQSAGEEGQQSVEEEDQQSVEEEDQQSVDEEDQQSVEEEDQQSVEEEDQHSAEEEGQKSAEEEGEESTEQEVEKSIEEGEQSLEEGEKSQEEGEKSQEEGEKSQEEGEKSQEEGENSEEGEKSQEEGENSQEEGEKSQEEGEKSHEEREKSQEDGEKSQEDGEKSQEEGEKSQEEGEKSQEEGEKSQEEGENSQEEGENSQEEGEKSQEGGISQEEAEKNQEDGEKSHEEGEKSQEEGEKSQEEGEKSQEQGEKSQEERDKRQEERERSRDVEDQEKGGEQSAEQQKESTEENNDGKVSIPEDDESTKTTSSEAEQTEGDSGEKAEESTKEEIPESTPEEELTQEVEIPENLRPRDHIAQLLHLDDESVEKELLLAKTVESTLKELKRLYDVAIKPLETVYKYRDLSNRHFGDPEIFSKPLILFMGPWSGGKSSIINYLLDNEYTKTALRTGAEPSPAYFNILMWGDHEEVLEGTQLAADWTFSGLQKFGQGLLDRLRGLQLPNKLLEKVNIVEIPGILEIRKQVERLFPFNDACQWFIDRADIIFLVYDPAKLDVGPETEAILDQLKGREYQTRIILNKADQVRPEELMRVQGTLVWNISPLMSSTEPPIMYSVSLWSIPYEQGAPLRLLQAQERAFSETLRNAVEKRVENKIASARRFAVRVRNHAEDGGLLPDHILQPQIVLWRPQEGQQRHHRAAPELPHLRRPQHTDQHLPVRPARP